MLITFYFVFLCFFSCGDGWLFNQRSSQSSIPSTATSGKCWSDDPFSQLRNAAKLPLHWLAFSWFTNPEFVIPSACRCTNWTLRSVHSLPNELCCWDTRNTKSLPSWIRKQRCSWNLGWDSALTVCLLLIHLTGGSQRGAFTSGPRRPRFAPGWCLKTSRRLILLRDCWRYCPLICSAFIPSARIRTLLSERNAVTFSGFLNNPLISDSVCCVTLVFNSSNFREILCLWFCLFTLTLTRWIMDEVWKLLNDLWLFFH